MGTRSKKWKSAVSFLAFLLGGALLLASVFLGLVGILKWDAVTDAFQSDYQYTRQFERMMSAALMNALDAADDGGGYAAALDDPNLLYEVWVDGKEVFTSDPAVPLFRGAPEGYPFYLHYDGAEAVAVRDGVPVDIYGNGYYGTGAGKNWCIPGYLDLKINFQNDAHVEVYLAAPDAPVRTPGYLDYYTVYWLTEKLEQNRRTVLALAAVPAAGILLFALYVLLRKDKKRADQTVAKLTGRVWVELKILILPLTVLWLGHSVESVRYMMFGGGVVQTLGWYAMIAAAPLLCYLYFNDLRYNGFKAVCRQNLCGTLFRLWRGEELKYPVGKRLRRRAMLGFAAMLPFALGTMAWSLLLPTTDHQNMVLAALLAFLSLLLLAAELYFLSRGLEDIRELDALLAQIEAVHAGDFTAPPELPEDADLRAACAQISDLRQSTEKALEERTRSERMKVELIANVSHDLKTPLTSIISYTELLSREEGLPDHVKDYVAILGQKSERLKTMVQEVFEVSKAASGELKVKREQIDLCKLLRQTLADMAEPIGRSGLCFRERLPDGEAPILADGDRLYRVFQNLIQNALQYSLPGSRVYITLELREGKAVAGVRNTSRDELPPGVDFTARFVRGDESRTDGGSGLGLAIARSFTEACGGAFHVEAVADLFTAAVEFPLARG